MTKIQVFIIAALLAVIAGLIYTAGTAEQQLYDLKKVCAVHQMNSASFDSKIVCLNPTVFIDPHSLEGK